MKHLETDQIVTVLRRLHSANERLTRELEFARKRHDHLAAETLNYIDDAREALRTVLPKGREISGEPLGHAISRHLDWIRSVVRKAVSEINALGEGIPMSAETWQDLEAIAKLDGDEQVD